MLYLFKTLLVNIFVGWIMFQCEQYFTSMDTFGGLDKFLERLARTLTFSDYVTKWRRSCYCTVKTWIETEEDIRTRTSTGPSIQDDMVISTRHRIAFFNTTKGRIHRLQSHGHYPLPPDKKNWGILCRKDGMPDSSKGRTTKYKCCKFALLLCLSVPAGLRESCWYVWHRAEHHVPRNVGTAGTRTPPVQ